MYACYAAGGNLSAYVGLAVQPVSQKYAWCAWHGQHECIGGNSVLLQGVKRFIRIAVLGIVILHESYRPLPMTFLVCQGIVAGIGRIAQKILAIVSVESIAYTVSAKSIRFQVSQQHLNRITFAPDESRGHFHAKKRPLDFVQGSLKFN
jgi:hypothetical protein